MTVPQQPGPPARGRIYPDDELYHGINSTWLGPKGFTLPFGVPYKAIPPFFAVSLIVLPVMRALGASGYWPWLAAIVTSSLAAAWVVKVSGSERPLTALAVIVINLTTAPRPLRRPGLQAELHPELVAIERDEPARPRRG